MAKANQTATHRASYNNYEANIYIADSLRDKLESGNYNIRKGARDSVCIRFRMAILARDHVDVGRVRWFQLRLRELNLAPARELAYVGPPSQRPRFTPTIEDDVTLPMFNAVGECDDCPSCEQGYHERCRNNCPQAGSGW